MYTRPHIESGRRDIGYGSIRSAANDHVATAFRGAAFDPINIVSVYDNMIKPQQTGRHAASR
jgi:hypothetical protein